MNKKLALSPLLDDGKAIPDYLHKVYWWAYVHPNAVKFFERQWLVNLILWGNFARLRNCALDALSDGQTVSGHTLQLACVYGDFTWQLSQRLSAEAQLDVVDVLPIQLRNLKQKLPCCEQVRCIQANSANLSFAATDTYDQAILFFLLHEQPEDTRRATLQEALRVVKPGGKIVVVDYHKPAAWHPLRYIMYPVLRWLEPYALALWQKELNFWLPQVPSQSIVKVLSCGGLYQQIVIANP